MRLPCSCRRECLAETLADGQLLKGQRYVNDKGWTISRGPLDFCFYFPLPPFFPWGKMIGRHFSRNYTLFSDFPSRVSDVPYPAVGKYREGPCQTRHGF